MLSLPVIDLANDPPTLQAERIRSALGSIGFFEVRNAGLKPEEIQRMFELVRRHCLSGPCSPRQGVVHDLGSSPRADLYLYVSLADTQSKELFAQPKDVKESYPANEIGLGYFKPHEQALGVYKRDNKESVRIQTFSRSMH